jgi:nucleoside-diphosphate-sugar epimerase
VAVADACSVPGTQVLAALATQARRTRALAVPVGIDTQRGSVAAAEWRLADSTSPAVAGVLRGVDVLVWVAASADLQSSLAVRAAARRERVVRTAQTLVTAAAASGVGRFVAVTSAKVYGASPDNPVPLAEDAPLRGVPDDGVVGDLLAVEGVLDEARRTHPGLAVTVVRPAALVGPGIDTVITRHFEAPRLLTVKGAHPAWQFCHIEDLASALVTVVTNDVGPVATVGCEGTLTQEQVERLTGMRRVQLSEAAALGTAQQLHRFGVLPAPASELALAIYPWAVDSVRVRAAGWRAAYDNETCLGVLLESIAGRHAVAARRVDRKDAALGAASAAVALVGTAAVLRRARRTRKREHP